MSLDFAIIGQNGAPERTVSLGVNLHQELITTALARGLKRFRDFEDYYEDAEISISDLPELAEQVCILHAQAESNDLRVFLHEFGQLIAYAVAGKKALYAIAD